ncbi:amidoligase family protein [Adlercreutzia sp. ZJ141]|uniref:amidoligase family protein n=1 Tax=Adlercreutzia sp. ZJ141 TaxID=2709406 RepID=UPI0013EAA9B9|nr:amidoligase family protein [Adlercreutzia sp. ZJ141]
MPRRSANRANTDPMFAFCRHCGQSFPANEQAVQGVCPDCLELLYCVCDGCGSLHHIDTSRIVHDTDQVLCPSCAAIVATECECCHEIYSANTRFVRDNAGRLRCPGCAEEYRECQGCGRHFHYDDLVEDDCGDLYCWQCTNGVDFRGVHSYSFKPEPKFHRLPGEDDNSLVFGIELEMDGNDPEAAIKRITSKVGEDWLYFKHDGSLNEGAELVTHPISPAYILSDEGRAMWRYICESAKAEGMRSHDVGTCGLHVHINRDFFGSSGAKRDIAEYKLLTIMDRFFEPMVIFSRRRPEQIGHWAQRLSLPKTADNWLTSARSASRISKGTRYYALNTTNRYTMEFRIFRGTLRFETLMATFQLLAGLCDFAAQATPGRLQTINWYELIDEAIAHCPGSTEELEAYLLEKELMTERKETKCA